MKYNKEYFSTSEIQGADKAGKLKQEIGWPSTSHFKDIVSKQLLRNCNVTVGDSRRAKLIYGSPTLILQIKMTRVKPKGAKIDRVPLSIPISQHHKDL